MGDINMKIQIDGIVPEGSSVNVSCGEQIQVIDAINKSVIFDVSALNDCNITIWENSSDYCYSRKNILIFFFTMLIQGICNVLLMNTDSKWYRDVRAYNLKASFHIYGNTSLHIQFTLSESKYVGNEVLWSYPEFHFQPDLKANVLYEKKPQGIKNAYFGYVKRVVSVFSILLLMLTFFLGIAILHEYHNVCYISTVLLAIMTILMLYMTISESRRCKKLINAFMRKEVSENN